MKDYLGMEITEGVRAIRVHSSGHYKDFKKGTIVSLGNNKVGFLTDGNTKMGWTYPERVIVAENFKGTI